MESMEEHMNTNQRTEPFRYTLKEPFTFDLHILSINGISVPTKPVRAVLFDISRSGCNLSLPHNINPENNQVRVGMEINFTDDSMNIEGTLLWNK
jgi:hypothetical protein